MQKIKVNILENPKMVKPSNKVIGIIQNKICSEENVKEIDFNAFVDLVGNNGAIWKSSLMEGGAKNINFKCAYVLSLDFDEGLSIKDFLENATDLGLAPTFIYETFSSTKEFNRFRAIWKLNEIIDNPQLKNALQLMLMEVFDDCDKNCKDLSRLWVGGKNVAFYNPMNTLNIENLRNATINSINMNSTNDNNARNIKSFCKKIGINIYNKHPFIIKNDLKIDGFWAKPNNISYYEMPENRQKWGLIVYDNFLFSFNDNFDVDKNKNKSTKIQAIKTDKTKVIKIDFENLKSKCTLFNDFINGKKLEHKEIQHLSFNLYESKGYSTLLKDTLVNNKYNNWQNKYHTYTSAINYNYSPTRCSNYCKYYSECNVLNIKEKYYQKESTVKKIEDIPTITLEEMQKQMDMIPLQINQLNDNTVMFIKTVTGSGKTEMITNMNLNNMLIGVSNHQLGQELYSRITQKQPNLDLLYVKALNTVNLPIKLKEEIEGYYNLGLNNMVQDVIFDEISSINELIKSDINYEIPSYYKDLKKYIDDLKAIPNANSLLFTHHRISYGVNNNKVDTIILDEDFLKTFVKYNTFKIGDLKEIIDLLFRFKASTEENVCYTEIYNILDNFYCVLDDNIGNYIENPLVQEQKHLTKLLTSFLKWCINKDYIKTINTNIFNIFSVEAIKLHENKDYISTISGSSIIELGKFKKVVILSATLDENIHIPFINKYLPSYNVEFINIDNVKLKGKIYCKCSYAWSRQALKNTTSKSIKALDKILDDDRFTNVITFKDDELIKLEGTDKIKIAHFGACEGLDKYKGQNLGVIGTPHTNSNLIEGYYFLLTNKNPISKFWKVKRVKKYGFEFDLNTYENETDIFLTNIQLYFCYSELIQAIGRARALRFDCKVFVFSALPLPNSTLI